MYLFVRKRWETVCIKQHVHCTAMYSVDQLIPLIILNPSSTTLLECLCWSEACWRLFAFFHVMWLSFLDVFKIVTPLSCMNFFRSNSDLAVTDSSIYRNLYSRWSTGGHWIWKVPVENLSSHWTVMGKKAYNKFLALISRYCTSLM